MTWNLISSSWITQSLFVLLIVIYILRIIIL